MFAAFWGRYGEYTRTLAAWLLGFGNAQMVFDTLEEWQIWHERAVGAGLRFGVEPKVRFGGDVLEHHTFFLIDPDHHWLEFKHYVHPEAIFGCLERQTVGDLDLRPAPGGVPHG